MVVGTSYESSKKAVELAEKYDELYATVGIHPVDDPSQKFDWKNFEALITSKKVVAIGECGMDFFHADRTKDYQRQKELFQNQIDFALKYNKPLMIHAREAYEEILQILEPVKKQYGEKLKGNVHFFAGDIVVARKFFDLGFTISFTGVITFTHDYDEVIKLAPLNMIMSETDSPYLTPVPNRGKRNEPAYVRKVVERIAEIRKEDEDVVRAALVNNALSMIG